MVPPGKKHSVRLCATFVRTVNVPGRYGDGYGGHGLSLPVTPRKSGGFSKTWAQAISPNGTKTSLGLGSYPVVNRRSDLFDRRRILMNDWAAYIA